MSITQVEILMISVDSGVKLSLLVLVFNNKLKNKINKASTIEPIMGKEPYKMNRLLVINIGCPYPIFDRALECV